MIQLKQFQQTAVDRLLIVARKLFRQRAADCVGGMVCVLKAPTGSGKTIIMAEFLKRLSEEFDNGTQSGYVFVWIAPRKLHTQSKDKLDSYLHHSVYSLITIEEMTADALPENRILFVNWEKLTNTEQSGDWTNVHVRDREDGRSIKEVLAKTRDEGRRIILIVDEAHLNIGDDRNNARRFIDEVIHPHVTFEVSATPQTVIPPEDLIDGKAGFVKVDFDEVVTEGLIKQETVINAGVENYTEFSGSADDVVLTAALAKRNGLMRQYQESGIAVNPLLLIQLPNDNKSMNALDNQMKATVEAFLAEKNITYENGKLAVWLSEEKSETLQDIERDDSSVEVLIFKTAIATGWDCPRAQILVMLRPMGSITFEIQTVGRILRMPEAKH